MFAVQAKVLQGPLFYVEGATSSLGGTSAPKHDPICSWILRANGRCGGSQASVDWPSLSINEAISPR